MLWLCLFEGVCEVSPCTVFAYLVWPVVGGDDDVMCPCCVYACVVVGCSRLRARLVEVQRRRQENLGQNTPEESKEGGLFTTHMQAVHLHMYMCTYILTVHICTYVHSSIVHDIVWIEDL